MKDDYLTSTVDGAKAWDRMYNTEPKDDDYDLPTEADLIGWPEEEDEIMEDEG